MSRTRQHTHHTDSTRARIAKDEANSLRRRFDRRFDDEDDDGGSPAPAPAVAPQVDSRSPRSAF